MIINVGNIFQIALPNKFKIVQLDIPIIKYTNPSTGEVLDDQVFCTDILDILTQDFFSRKNKGVVDDTQKNSSAVEDVVVHKLLELKTFTDFLFSKEQNFYYHDFIYCFRSISIRIDPATKGSLQLNKNSENSSVLQ